MNELRLADFCNKHAGKTASIVGRGPTRFDYRDLAEGDGPVMFVNDAVAMECHLRPDQSSYFFALDKSMAVWLPKIRSIAVLPTNHTGRRGVKILQGPDDPALASAHNVILWKTRLIARSTLLQSSREEVARIGQLYRGIGTIYTPVHFAWLTGCPKIRFIGCDGINDLSILREHGNEATGYDARLPNLSSSRPWWKYTKIRAGQEKACRLLGLEVEYVGSPVE